MSEQSQAKPPAPTPLWIQYVVAICSIALALGFRWALIPWMGDTFPFLMVSAVLMVLVVRFSPGPFLAAAVLGLSASSLIFTPKLTDAFTGTKGGYSIILFIISIVAAFFATIISEGTRQRERNARIEAEERREALRVTLSSIGDAVITTDNKGLVTFLNPVAEHLTGWSTRDANGVGLHEVFRIVNEHTRQPVENPAEKVLKTGQIVGLANHTVLIGKDNSERPIDDSAAPILGADGEVSGAVLVFRDITERKRSEAALRRSEQELSDFFENASVGLHWMGPDGTILRANKAELEMLGYSREEYLGHNIAEFHVDQEVVGELLAIKEEENIHNRAAQVRHKSGAILDVLIDTSVLYVDGQFVHTRCFTRDVTELKKIEQNSAHLAAIVESSDDAIVSKTLQGQILTWNKGAEQIFGYSPGEAVGQSINLIIPAELQEEEQALLKRLAGGEKIEHFETIRVAKSGKLLNISLSVSPVVDKFGQVVAASKVGRDMTERKKTERDILFLAQASASLASLVDYESTLQNVARLAVPHFADWCTIDMVDTPDSLKRVAVAHVDPAKLEYVNELRRQLPPNPQSGVWEVVRSGQSRLVTEITDELLEASVDNPETLAIVRNLGLKSYMGVPLTVRGKVLGVITFVGAESGRRFIAQDLSMAEDLAHRAAIAIDNAQLYQEARQNDQRKDEFLATLAHELRNPLAPIRNALAIFQAEGEMGEMTSLARDLMERQVDQMVHLVDDLLDLSRINRDKLEMRWGETQLSSVIEQAVETAQPGADRDGHRLEVQLPEEPVYLWADPMRLAQVFSNLLTNACKFSDAGGEILVRAVREGSEVVVSVKDSGIGIPADKLKSIFEMFGQVDSARERSRGGLGIGLTLVKRVVELHRGSVSAFSEGPGKGSEFVVRLPVRDGAEPAAGVEVAEPESSALRVLVVDDNADATESLTLYLGMLGNDVRGVHDGAAAVAAVAEFKPDVVLMDIGLPIMNGYEACRKIRALPEGRGILVVAMTGWGQDEDRRRSEEAGFDRHLVKPVDPKMIREMLANYKK